MSGQEAAVILADPWFWVGVVAGAVIGTLLVHGVRRLLD